jgi:hypothetical protein
MKKLILLLFIPFISFSQNLTFIGENSYPSTIEFEFENKERDLFITFLKDNENTLIMLKTKNVLDYKEPTIDGKMIIYLDNGKVISSSTPNYKDYVDYFCISIYPLNKSDIDDIINSNINSIRYAIVDKYEKIANRVASNTANSPVNKSLKEFIKLE